MRAACVFACFLLAVSVLPAQQTVGLISQSSGSREGYVLFAPLHSKTTYLVDKCGRQVHSWTSRYTPAQSAYLLPDGTLLRTGNDSSSYITAVGGKIERLGWNNEVLWSYTISSPTERQHHDIYPMPNGNVLVIVYKKRTRLEAIAAGRDPAAVADFILDEKIVEVKPICRDSGTVVWEWDVWDHLVQDRDSTLPNYGKIAFSPQRFNINYLASAVDDWLHFNSVAYNEKLDQVMVSIHHFNEIFIIDHSTTTAQAAGHSGGKQGKGGDLLYRWGNPASYNAGNAADQKLFAQHNAHWIAKGLPDAGKVMIFNNGLNRPGENYSCIEIIELPVDKKGNYLCEAGKAYGPLSPSWNYTAPNATRFFSKNISGAQRLANGNTLICSGSTGRFFEINPAKEIVWAYTSPVTSTPVAQGSKDNGQVFRCSFYEPSYKGLKGHKLIPGVPIELNPGNTPCFTK